MAGGRPITIGKLRETFSGHSLGKRKGFSKYGQRQQRTILLILSKALGFLGGDADDKAALLLRYLEHDPATRKALGKDINPGKTSILQRVADAFQKAASKVEKKYLLGLVHHLSRPTLLAAGICVSSKQLHLSRRRAVLFKQQKRKRRAKASSLARAKKIDQLGEQHAVPAFLSGAVRTPLRDDSRRVLTETRGWLGKRATSARICSRATLYRCLPKRFVKPRRKTDMCRYCDTLRRLSARGKWRGRVAKELRYHQTLYRRQQRAYEGDVKKARDPDSGVLVIRPDYKGGTVIGQRAVARDDEPFNVSSVRVCGFIIYLPGTGLKQPICYDHASDVLDEKSETSCFLLWKTLERLSKDPATAQAFKKVHTIRLYCDCGNHFRSRKFAWFSMWKLFDKLPHVQTVSLNFFGEKHGKGECDQHFAEIAAILYRYMMHKSQDKMITTVSDFISVLRAQHNEMNGQRKADEEAEVTWWIDRYTRADLEKDSPVLSARVKQLKFSYSLSRERSNDPSDLKNHIFSDCEPKEILSVKRDSVRRREIGKSARTVKASAQPVVEQMRRKRLWHETML